LLVEDDDEVAALTVEMINQLGYDTTRVASAESRLGCAGDKRAIDIVFSDVMMPGRMNGVELAQEIRRRRPNLPVLLTSGFAEAASRSAAVHRIRIIPKPYRIDELREALAAAAHEEAKETHSDHAITRRPVGRPRSRRAACFLPPGVFLQPNSAFLHLISGSADRRRFFGAPS